MTISTPVTAVLSETLPSGPSVEMFPPITKSSMLPSVPLLLFPLQAQPDCNHPDAVDTRKHVILADEVTGSWEERRAMLAWVVLGGWGHLAEKL